MFYFSLLKQHRGQAYGNLGLKSAGKIRLMIRKSCQNQGTFHQQMLLKLGITLGSRNNPTTARKQLQGNFYGHHEWNHKNLRYVWSKSTLRFHKETVWDAYYIKLLFPVSWYFKYATEKYERRYASYTEKSTLKEVIICDLSMLTIFKILRKAKFLSWWRQCRVISKLSWANAIFKIIMQKVTEKIN